MDAARIEKAHEAVMAAREAGLLREDTTANLLPWLAEERYARFREELVAIVEAADWEDLNDRFYRVLPFGTGGRRGPVGLGTNRVNAVTIAEGAQGVADCLNAEVSGRRPRIVVAWDTRTTADELVTAAASVFAGNGVETLLFEGFRATPELSFAIRHLDCDAGVVISASHNPPEDNGFKAYWRDGGQVVSPRDSQIIAAVEAVEAVRTTDLDEARRDGLVRGLGGDVDQDYYGSVLEQGFDRTPASRVGHDDLKIVYTPLHGVGIRSVLPVLEQAGFSNVQLVESQAFPDGNFPNVPNHTPNPEITTGLEAAIAQARETKADIVMASDPDADRLAVAVRADAASADHWIPMTGNQLGALLGTYVLDSTQAAGLLRPEHLVCTTVVTSPMLDTIARSYGVRVVGDLLVGFKYIAEQIELLADPDDFLFGTEESIGYMKGPYTRDKDAAAAALLTAELAWRLKREGRTLLDALDELYARYGYFCSHGGAVFFEGLAGTEKMAAVVEKLRTAPPTELGGLPVKAAVDRLNGVWFHPEERVERPYALPGGHTNNLVILRLDDSSLAGEAGVPSVGRSWVAVRPSGTEPKIKFYYSLFAPVPSATDLAGVKTHVDAAMQRLDEALRQLALG